MIKWVYKSKEGKILGIFKVEDGTPLTEVDLSFKYLYPELDPTKNGITVSIERVK